MGQDLLPVAVEVEVEWAALLQLAQVEIVFVRSAAIKKRMLLDNHVIRKRVQSAARK